MPASEIIGAEVACAMAILAMQEGTPMHRGATFAHGQDAGARCRGLRALALPHGRQKRFAHRPCGYRRNGRADRAAPFQLRKAAGISSLPHSPKIPLDNAIFTVILSYDRETPMIFQINFKSGMPSIFRLWIR